MNLIDGARSVGTRFLVDEHRGSRMSVHLGGIVVEFIAQLHIGDIFQPKHVTAGQGLDDQLAELFRRG